MMGRMNLCLRPMTAEEFDAWLPRLVAGYAKDIVAADVLPPAAAEQKAEREHGHAVP